MSRKFILKVHLHRVTRLTTRAGVYKYFIVLLTSWCSFVANGIQLASPESGDGSEVNSYWSCTRPFFPTQYTEKSGLATRDYFKQTNVLHCLCRFRKFHNRTNFYASTECSIRVVRRLSH